MTTSRDRRLRANQYAKKYYYTHKQDISAARKKFRLFNAEKLNASTREWKLKNRAQYLKYGRVYARWYRTNNHRKFVSAKLKAVYGITLEDYETLHKKQKGRCAICNKPNPYNRRWRRPTRLAIDHHHGTRQIRGLLCHTCNNGLGCFKDDVRLLELALEYLKR